VETVSKQTVVHNSRQLLLQLVSTILRSWCWYWWPTFNWG